MILRRFMQHIKEQNWFAVGLDIIVVIVGIFLGMQVQQWYEDIQLRDIEKKVLLEIQLDMDINRRDIGRMIEEKEQRLARVTELNEHLINKKPAYDRIGTDLRLASSTQQFEPRTMGYASFNANGINIVRNEEVRNSIIRMYGLWFQRLIMEGREYEQFDNPTIDLLPYLKKHLVVDTNSTDSHVAEDIDYKYENYGLAVKDYDALLNDSEFLLILQKTMYNRAEKIILAKRIVDDIEDLEELLKAELAEM